MRTFIEIMKWVSGILTCMGFAYAVGMMVADSLYRTALGFDAYLDLMAISPWDVLWMLVVGVALATITSILDSVFKSGESSASKKEQEND